MKVEDLALKLYDLVEAKKSTIEIVNTLHNDSFAMIGRVEILEMEEIVDNYRKTRTGLEKASRSIKAILYPEIKKESLSLSTNTDLHNYSRTLQRSIRDLSRYKGKPKTYSKRPITGPISGRIKTNKPNP